MTPDDLCFPLFPPVFPVMALQRRQSAYFHFPWASNILYGSSDPGTIHRAYPETVWHSSNKKQSFLFRRKSMVPARDVLTEFGFPAGENVNEHYLPVPVLI